MSKSARNPKCQPLLPGDLRGKRVLELGAGTGVAGLAAALLGAQVAALSAYSGVCGDCLHLHDTSRTTMAKGPLL